MLRIPFEELKAEFTRVLFEKGAPSDVAELAGRLFAENSRDGVYSHGLNRFPTIVKLIDEGRIRPAATPRTVLSRGGFQRWDGNLGLGNVTATRAMARAVELSRRYGIGCVAVRNTNHWLRGGTYGWQAAEAGCVGLCWTNAIPPVPAWGGGEPPLGDNPLVVAVPRGEGPVVLDMALSQFSFGKMEEYRMAGKMLPFPGGYDEAGEPTSDPAVVERTKTALPVGFWKGSGLAMVLDLAAALLSEGRGSLDFDEREGEFGVSQVFLAIDADSLVGREVRERVVTRILNHVHASTPVTEGGRVYYPGERTLLTRRENLEKGVPVNEEVWKIVQAM